jgi:hypothetical protein
MMFRLSRCLKFGSVPLALALMLMMTVAACGEEAPTPKADVPATIASALARLDATATAAAPAPADSGEPPAHTFPTSQPLQAGNSADAPAPTQPATPSGQGTEQPDTRTATPEPTQETVPAADALVPLEDLQNWPYLQQDPLSATAIEALAWVADGVYESEAESVEELINLGAFYPYILFTALSYPWVADGVTGQERDVVESLHAIAQRDSGSAETIGSMPFLNSLEPADYAAMRSLRQLAFFEPDTFRRMLAHPSLRPGITDEWAKIVAMASGVQRVNPGLINTLLDTNRISLEQRTLQLPESGETLLLILRTGPGAARSMDLLETAVRQAEQFMGEPFPTNYIGVLFGDAVIGSAAGVNVGTHIAIRPKFDVDDGSQEADFSGHVIAHEVAHYYWNGNADWIDEGASDFLASIVENVRTGKPVSVTNQPCAAARNIRALESLNVNRDSNAFDCNYALGERLFVDLFLSMGNAAFRQGFRTLYLASEVADSAGDMRGTPVGIGQVTASFRASSDQAVVDTVVRRWYDGTAPYDIHRRDTGAVDPTLPGINGRIDAAYISTTQRGPTTVSFSASATNDVVWLNLDYSYQLAFGSRDVNLTIVEFYEDGFETRRRDNTISADAGFIGGNTWYSIGPASTQRWATGRYWVYVYDGDRKVAEVGFEVTK